MLGAIIGDIVGSRFELNNHKSKDFELFTDECFFTDGTVMTLAVAKAIQESKPDASDLCENAVKYMQEVGRHYPDCGYSGRFHDWIFSDNPEPYNSFGNGSAMRVSACVEGLHEDTLAKAYRKARRRMLTVTQVTHGHPDGLCGADAVAMAAFYARTGKTKEEIREKIDRWYTIDFTLDEIRDTYQFDETCEGTVPQALEAFFESTDFEDAIRNAVSIGGDSDTIAAITGTIAEAYYGIPARLQQIALSYLDDRLLDIYEDFQEFCGLKYMEPESLEGGKVLYVLKRMFLDKQSRDALNPLIDCLRDSIVRVPGRAVLTDADRERFLDGIRGGVGTTFSNEDEITFEPDLLDDNDGNIFFPMFCNDEQMPNEYKEHFSIKDMTVVRCIELAKMRGNVTGLVLDPFTEPMPITMELAHVIDFRNSRIKIRDDHRVLNCDTKFLIDDLTEEEFNSLGVR